MSRGATLFCCIIEMQPQEINGFYRASLLISAASSEGLGFLRKSTGSQRPPAL